jgi:biotin carboxyl carrier protein
MTRYELMGEGGPFTVEVTQAGDQYRVLVSGKEYVLKLSRQEGQNTIVVDMGGRPVSIALTEASPQQVQFTMGGERLSYRRATEMRQLSAPPAPTASASTDAVTAPMPGKVVATLVRKGEKVKAGDPLVVLESMKMEVAVRSDRDAEVGEIVVKEGMAVKRGQALVRLV